METSSHCLCSGWRPILDGDIRDAELQLMLVEVEHRLRLRLKIPHLKIEVLLEIEERRVCCGASASRNSTTRTARTRAAARWEVSRAARTGSKGVNG